MFFKHAESFFMNRIGLAGRMTQAKHIVRCPKCGFTFDVSYGRTFACGGCPSMVQCGMAKCPKCEHEFPLPSRYGEAYRKYVRKFE